MQQAKSYEDDKEFGFLATLVANLNASVGNSGISFRPSPNLDCCETSWSPLT